MSRKGIWPAPVYEAHFNDGTVERLSFWSPEGKPIDFAHGRAVAEAICLTIWDEASRTWERGKDGAWRARWARDASRQIISGYVEHPNIGRVADTLEAGWSRDPIALHQRVSWKALAEAARKALERGNPAEALGILQRAA